MIKARGSIVFCILVSVFSGLYAQDKPPPIISDRPTASASSYTVPFEALMLESGGQYSYGEAGAVEALTKTKAFTTPLLLRYGLLENLELRVATDGVSWQNERTLAFDSLNDKSTTGFANPSLGLKWQINNPEEDSYQPSVGFLFDWSLPVGSEAFSPEKSEIELTGLLNFPLPKNFGLTLNGAVGWPYDSDTESCYTQGFGAVALSNGLTDRTGVFVEVYIDSPTSDGGHEQIFMDAGATYLVAPGYQIDFAVFKGLGRVSSDWAVAGGLTFYILDGT
ncbi:MAG TPA: transporter [Acidobacteriota bacterium]|nr:transporter [Acidobacteriota bacterium]